VGLLLGLTLLFCGRIVFRGEVLYWGDILLQFEPWRSYSQASLFREGVLPLWNPYTFCGMPFLANAQSAVFYPLNLVLPGLAPARMLSYSAVLHVFLAGAFMLLYLRRLRLDRWAAVTGALVYMFSGFLITRWQFPSITTTCAWLPLLFWGLERLWQRPTAGRVATLAGIIGVQFLAGHTQFSLFSLLLLGAYGIARLGAAWRDGATAKWLWARIVAGSMAGLGGLALAAVQLAPTYELVRNSPRQNFTYQDVTRFSLPPWHLPTLVLPNLFGTPARDLYWGGGNHWEGCGYVGLVPVLLLGSGISLRGGRRAWFFGAVAGVALLLAMGRYAPFYRLAYEALPLFRLFRDPARFVYWWTFALAVLAAYGAAALHAAHPQAGKIWKRVLTAAIGCGIIIATLVLTVTTQFLGRLVAASLTHTPTLSYRREELSRLTERIRLETLEQIVLACTLLGVVYVLSRHGSRTRWFGAGLAGCVAADLFWFGLGYNPTTSLTAFSFPVVPEHPPEREARRLYTPSWAVDATVREFFNFSRFGDSSPSHIRSIREQFPPNVNVAEGVLSASGYDPLRVRSLERWREQVETTPDPVRRATLLSWMAVDTIWLPRASVSESPPDSSWRTGVLPREATLPRAFITRGPLPDLPEEVPVTRFPVAPVDLVSHSPQCLTARWREPRAGTLVVLDTHYPGWQLYRANGRDPRPSPAKFVFRATPVSREEQAVTWVYRPAALLSGLYASLAAWSVVVGIGTWERRRSAGRGGM
jgi:hypothetical protein